MRQVEQGVCYLELEILRIGSTDNPSVLKPPDKSHCGLAGETLTRWTGCESRSKFALAPGVKNVFCINDVFRNFIKSVQPSENLEMAVEALIPCQVV